MRNVLAIFTIVGLITSCIIGTARKETEETELVNIEENNDWEDNDNEGSVPDCFEDFYYDVTLPDGSVVRYQLPPFYCFPPRLPDRDPPTYEIIEPIADPIDKPLAH